MLSRILGVLGRTALLAALCAGAGIGYNAIRPAGGLPLVAQAGFYDNKVFVPCPEVLSEPEPLAPARILAWSADSILVVDARSAEEYAAGHHAGAVSFPYSALFAPGEEEIRDLSARAQKRAIVVCGDEDIGSGRLLAAELVEGGLPTVYYVEGGCLALARERK